MGKFSKEDVLNMQGFAKFISEKGKFNLDWAESIQLAKYSGFITEIIKKINDHIIELERVIEPPKTRKSK